MIRSLLAAAALAGSLSLVACAAAPPPATSPEAPPPGAFGGPREATPADAEMLTLAHAEEEIDRLFANRDAAPTLRSPSKKGPEAPPQPEKPSLDQPAAPSSSASGDPCAVACRALASMASSADRLCHLAGENDGRCDDARNRVRGASARVKSACPGCAAGLQAR